MIKIYGSPRSSAGRCFLVLEELGLPYETPPFNIMERKDHKSAEFLKLNPNGKVPCLVDGDFVIWESMAINHYLVDKYRPAFLGTTPEERGLSQQWSLWTLSELQPPMVDIIVQMMFVPEDRRDLKVVEKAREKVPPLLDILERQLEGREWLVGHSFLLVDLNVASVVNIAQTLKIDLEKYKHLTAWFSRIKARPSFRKFAELRTQS
jgi:glutathione S-transferase